MTGLQSAYSQKLSVRRCRKGSGYHAHPELALLAALLVAGFHLVMIAVSVLIWGRSEIMGGGLITDSRDYELAVPFAWVLAGLVLTPVVGWAAYRTHLMHHGESSTRRGVIECPRGPLTHTHGGQFFLVAGLVWVALALLLVPGDDHGPQMLVGTYVAAWFPGWVAYIRHAAAEVAGSGDCGGCGCG